MQRYNFELTEGDKTILHLRSVELGSLSAVWGQIAELTENVAAPKSRIRVTDQSGAILISIGIATARILQRTNQFVPVRSLLMLSNDPLHSGALA